MYGLLGMLLLLCFATVMALSKAIAIAQRYRCLAYEATIIGLCKAISPPDGSPPRTFHEDRLILDPEMTPEDAWTIIQLLQQGVHTHADHSTHGRN